MGFLLFMLENSIDMDRIVMGKLRFGLFNLILMYGLIILIQSGEGITSLVTKGHQGRVGME